MKSAFTAKVYHAGKAPKRIALLGDKTKRPESAQHVIEFPGGAIELTRTTDGDYWAHILINRGPVIGDVEGSCSALGEVVDARIGREHPFGVDGIENHGAIEQLAVLIRRVRP
jgi:hypothetical protein